MALRGELVDVVARDVPLLGDAFGTLALVNQIVSFEEGWVQLFESAADVAKHRDARHASDARADGIVHVAGCDRLGRKMNGLLTRSTHPVQSHRGNGDRQAGQKHTQPAY